MADPEIEAGGTSGAQKFAFADEEWFAIEDAVGPIPNARLQVTFLARRYFSHQSAMELRDGLTPDAQWAKSVADRAYDLLFQVMRPGVMFRSLGTPQLEWELEALATRADDLADRFDKLIPGNAAKPDQAQFLEDLCLCWDRVWQRPMVFTNRHHEPTGRQQPSGKVLDFLVAAAGPPIQRKTDGKMSPDIAADAVRAYRRIGPEIQQVEPRSEFHPGKEVRTARLLFRLGNPHLLGKLEP